MSVSWGDLQKLASEAGFTNPPAGDYEMEITKSSHKKTSNGKDMITVIFKVVAGPQMGATQPHNFVISPESAGAMGFFFRYMTALGLDAAFFSSYASMPFGQVPPIIAPMLVGKRAKVTIGADRNDAERLVVTSIKRAAVGADIPMTPTQMASGLDIFAPSTVTAAPAQAAPAPTEPATTPQESAPENGITPPELPF